MFTRIIELLTTLYNIVFIIFNVQPPVPKNININLILENNKKIIKTDIFKNTDNIPVDNISIIKPEYYIAFFITLTVIAVALLGYELLRRYYFDHDGGDSMFPRITRDDIPSMDQTEEEWYADEARRNAFAESYNAQIARLGGYSEDRMPQDNEGIVPSLKRSYTVFSRTLNDIFNPIGETRIITVKEEYFRNVPILSAGPYNAMTLAAGRRAPLGIQFSSRAQYIRHLELMHEMFGNRSYNPGLVSTAYTMNAVENDLIDFMGAVFTLYIPH